MYLQSLWESISTIDTQVGAAIDSSSPCQSITHPYDDEATSMAVLDHPSCPTRDWKRALRAWSRVRLSSVYARRRKEHAEPRYRTSGPPRAIEPSPEVSRTNGRAKLMARVSETMGDEMGRTRTSQRAERVASRSDSIRTHWLMNTQVSTDIANAERATYLGHLHRLPEIPIRPNLSFSSALLQVEYLIPKRSLRPAVTH